MIRKPYFVAGLREQMRAFRAVHIPPAGLPRAFARG
jgi:hypothetical protein